MRHGALEIILQEEYLTMKYEISPKIRRCIPHGKTMGGSINIGIDIKLPTIMG